MGRPVFPSVALILFLAGMLSALPASGAPKPDLWPRWEAYDPESAAVVDHGPWDRFLGTYLDTSHPSGVNLVDYRRVTEEDRSSLRAYLQELQGVKALTLNRSEQRAFWINLYNALTVKLVIEHYPVGSIREIDISPGLFAYGPWGAKLLTIEGERVTLNDIEHRILRPIWQDSRLHYALNCASLGCPNLQARAYTASNTEGLLERGAGNT